jgi:hypothetical protein
MALLGSWITILQIIQANTSSEKRQLTFQELEKIESARLYGNIHEYAYWFVDLLVGSPPQRASVIVDTGSTICGFVCTVCKKCGKHIDSAFDIGLSSTATWSKCSNDCPSGSCLDGKCSYSVAYTEGSSVAGLWFTDYAHLGDLSERNLPVLSHLGCHTSETKLFYSQSANGILGIAPRKAGVFPTILGSLFSDPRINKNVFSLCLSEEGGELTVGGFNNSYLASPLAWYDMQADRFYRIQIQRIRIGSSVVSSPIGNSIVDSGTTLVYFPPSVFKSLAFHIETILKGVKKTNSRCWKTADRSLFPVLSFDIVGGSKPVDWHPDSYVYSSNGDLCVGFDQGTSHETVLGASWMIGKSVVFDLEGKLGIGNSNCPSYSTRPNLIPATSTPIPPKDTTSLKPTVAVTGEALIKSNEEVEGNAEETDSSWNDYDASSSRDEFSGIFLATLSLITILSLASVGVIFFRRRRSFGEVPEERVEVIPKQETNSIKDIESQDYSFLPIK